MSQQHKFAAAAKCNRHSSRWRHIQQTQLLPRSYKELPELALGLYTQ